MMSLDSFTKSSEITNKNATQWREIWGFLPLVYQFSIIDNTIFFCFGKICIISHEIIKILRI